MSLNSISLPDGTRYVLEEQTPPAPPSSVQLWRMKPRSNPRDAATKAARDQGQPKHGFPDIIPLAEGIQKVKLTRQWQMFIRSLNPNMTLQKVSALLAGRVAFTNGTSWGSGEDDPPYQNWILGQNTNNPNNPLPELDKVRTCGYACHTGAVVGNELQLTVFDGNLPPPDIAEVNPLTFPHLFFYATIVWMDGNGRELSRVPFTQRARAWGHDFEVTVMPLVSMHVVRVALEYVEPVDSYQLPFYNYP